MRNLLDLENLQDFFNKILVGLVIPFFANILNFLTELMFFYLWYFSSWENSW